MTTQLIIFGARDLIFVILAIAVFFFARLPRQKKIDFVLFAALSLPLAYLAAKLAALGFPESRPFIAENFVPLVSHEDTNSFPSGHTLFSTAFALLVFVMNRSFGLFLLVLALLVGAGRVFAGVHYPIDIAGGFLIACAAAYAASKLLPFVRALYDRCVDTKRNVLK